MKKNNKLTKEETFEFLFGLIGRSLFAIVMLIFVYWFQSNF